MISSHITLAILAIIAILSSTTNAQLSTLPKRYRSNKVQTSPTTTVKHTLKQHKTKKNGNLRKKRYLRKDPELNYMSMNSLFTTRMSLSMPNLEEARFGIPDLDFMSMPLEEARFDIPIGSMPLNVFDDIEPDNSDGDMNMMSVGLGKSSSSSDTLILASMLAGLSALVVGSAAVFVKMRKVHSDQCIEDKEEEEEMEMQQQQQQLDPEERVVSFASQDELYQPDDSEEYDEYDNVQDLPLY